MYSDLGGLVHDTVSPAMMEPDSMEATRVVQKLDVTIGSKSQLTLNCRPS